MSIVIGINKLHSLSARGKFGRSGGFGLIRFGYNYFGFYSPHSGIYQRRKLKKSNGYVKTTFYRPTNPQTVKQQNWRAVCAYGWVRWSVLSTDQKKQYRLLGRKYKMSGPNLFFRNWLKSPTHGFGKIIFSYNRFGLQ